MLVQLSRYVAQIHGDRRYVLYLKLSRPTAMFESRIPPVSSSSEMLCAVTRGVLPFLCLMFTLRPMEDEHESSGDPRFS